MKVVVCGTVVPVKFETEIEKLSNAGNRFLMNFVQTLSRKNEVSVMSFISVPVKKAVRKKIAQEKTGFPIKYFFAEENRLQKIMQYKKAVKEELRRADCIITYNAMYAWLFAPCMAKSMGKQSLLILADYSPAGSYRSFARKIYASLQLRMIRKYDCVVGLSRNTKDFLRKGQNFFCMEGGIDRSFYDYFDRQHQSDDGIVRLMYAGILEPVTGIEQLILAFQEVHDENVRLMISGKGSLTELVETAAKEDGRIVYLGCMPYHDYMEKLKNADVFVNPRDLSLAENRYNFPSKVLEYLGTGKRIISTKFPGWEKFSEHILFCESSVAAIRESMEKICRDRHGGYFMGYQKNREFAEQFIWDKQIDRVLENMQASEYRMRAAR